MYRRGMPSEPRHVVNHNHGLGFAGTSDIAVPIQGILIPYLLHPGKKQFYYIVRLPSGDRNAGRGTS
jgi:hypothetical protein